MVTNQMSASHAFNVSTSLQDGWFISQEALAEMFRREREDLGLTRKQSKQDTETQRLHVKIREDRVTGGRHLCCGLDVKPPRTGSRV